MTEYELAELRKWAIMAAAPFAGDDLDARLKAARKLFWFARTDSKPKKEASSK